MRASGMKNPANARIGIDNKKPHTSKARIAKNMGARKNKLSLKQ